MWNSIFAFPLFQKSTEDEDEDKKTVISLL